MNIHLDLSWSYIYDLLSLYISYGHYACIRMLQSVFGSILYKLGYPSVSKVTYVWQQSIIESGTLA